MSARLAPAILALIVGAVLAVLLFVPLVAASYRRNGAMTPLRTAGWAASLLWVLGLWAYVLLPLPAPDTIRCTSAQLVPFEFVSEILRRHAAGTPILANLEVHHTLLNILLFTPLGVLLRGIFGLRLRWALLGGFGMSLFVETTQLTGTWGLYACSYRVFDVDDLMTNTLGAVLGWTSAWALTRGRAIDTRPTATSHLTAGRRLTGMGADWLVAELLAFVSPAMATMLLVDVLGLPLGTVDDVANLGVGTAVALLVHLAVLLRTSATIGEHAVLLASEPAGAPGSKPSAGALLVRFGFGIGGYLVLSALPMPWGLAGLAYGLVCAVAVLRDAGHRGLAARLAGLVPVDHR